MRSEELGVRGRRTARGESRINSIHAPHPTPHILHPTPHTLHPTPYYTTHQSPLSLPHSSLLTPHLNIR
ncbi:hypothetical protein [Scytonema millei]|uniref:Uncharacterized protein n=1 Tax=Scytonema millei VB511283 TaxID=1245923 RepID=A0A9X5E9S4_9CYAN|nr:hypothetical protein [Scytonema millei]NHC36687.1 hypothetical protein [Scytonema millei VB511283]